MANYDLRVNHSRVYDEIIEFFRQNPLSEKCYGENHHIVPKSLGGSNEKENIVRLTARAHFICHMLLVRIHTGEAKKKMWCALHFMTIDQKHRSSARQYEKIKLEFSKTQKERIDQSLIDGTHPFLDRQAASARNRKRLKEGTHNFSDLEFQKKQTELKKKRGSDGTHHFCGKQNPVHQRINDKVHNWQDSKAQSELNLRRVRNGTHPFLGDRNPSKRRVKDGTHHFLNGEIVKNSWADPICREKRIKSLKLGQQRRHARRRRELGKDPKPGDDELLK